MKKLKRPSPITLCEVFHHLKNFHFQFFTYLFFFILTSFFCESLQVADLSYTEVLKPGDYKQIKISIYNDKDIPEQINFKVCDYGCNAEGEHFYEPPLTFQKTNAPWIQLSASRVTLRPQERRDYFFSIRIPKSQSLNGSYWSAILIEPADFLDTVKDDKLGLQLKIKIRYAYHVITTIGETRPKLEVIQTKLKEIDGKDYLFMDVKNSGNLFLNPFVKLKLFNQNGELEKVLISQKDRIYPGFSQRYFFEAKQLERKKYVAFFLLDNGDKHLFGDTFELNLLKNP